VLSPVLANLFLHYAFDAWMAREFPAVSFERYVDDAVVHCVSERQARFVLKAIMQRMEAVGLALHPDKTRVVYCQDGKRRGSHEHTSFTFLGFTFRARGARRKDGGDVHRVPARDQQGCPEEDQRGGAVLEAAPSHRPHLRRPRTKDQPDCAGLDDVLVRREALLFPDGGGRPSISLPS
jgi:RNA-directed DNA polymerase